MDLATWGFDLFSNMSCVFADNEQMIASVMSMQDMLEILFFKERLRALVRSCDKFGNLNDDYVKIDYDIVNFSTA